MAVTFTSNIGLAKPTEDELARNWVNSSDLVEDNNIIIADKSTILLTSYTPTLIGPTTNPGVGAGEIKGEYIEFQGYIFGGFNIYFVSPGIVVGSGAGGYGIKLPTLVDTAFHVTATALNQAPGSFACIGEGYLSDSSAVGTSGTVALDVVRIGGVDYARFITEAYAGKTVEWMGPNIPAAVADQDQWSGQFWYKKA